MYKTVCLIIATCGVALYLYFAIRYYTWLWHHKTDAFKKWLETRTGYPITVRAGYRSISFNAPPEAPLKIRLLVPVCHFLFMVFSGMVPILAMGLLGFIIYLMEIHR